MMKLFLVIMFSFLFNTEGSVGLIFYICVYLILSFFMLFNYMMSVGGDHWIFISGYLSYDSYSYYLILLTIWVLTLMFMSLMGEESNSSGLMDKVMIFNFILFLLVMFFGVSNLMLLYFFFEVSLIPTFVIVYLWGGNLERIEASFFLLVYMMFISFPLLAYLLKIYLFNFSLDLNINSLMSLNDFKDVVSDLDLLILLGAFFIKLPIYMFHIWLPKAHVEAPVYGSMLLAAILLKLGGYGLLRLLVMFIEKCVVMGGMIISLSCMGAMYVSILCLTQVDMKSLVAYSSVVHMNLMLCALMTMMKMGFIGAFVMMISHGLCSSGLFFMVNLFYKRSFSRLIVLNRGFLNLIPFFSIWWFLLCSSNFAFPFSVNFIGEIMMIMVMVGWSLNVMIILALISFFSGAYSLYLFSVVYHGGIIQMMSSKAPLSGGLLQGECVSEHLNLFMHYYPLLFIMVNLIVFMY